MEVIQRDNIIVKRFINPFKKSNSFLLDILEVEGSWLFDIGDSQDLLTAISSCRINGLFLTHSHFDHIFHIKELQREQPECVIYGSKKCLEWLNDDRRNLSFYYEKPLEFNPKNCVAISENENIKLTDSVVVQAYATPGHSEDSMTFSIMDFLITGDSYIPYVPPVTKLKGGNKEQYAISLAHIKSLLDIDTVLLPGHGPVYTNPAIID